MDNEIRVGDLVMVVRPMPCCGDARDVGICFRVEEITKAYDGWCVNCGSGHPNDCATDPTTTYEHPIKTLKKINPPAQGDEVSTREPLSTTA